MATEDKDLERIKAEVAAELNISAELVNKVYNHYIGYLFKRMTQYKYRDMNKEYKRQHAVNISIPGFGRILHKFGKSFKNSRGGTNGNCSKQPGDETSETVS